jgi:hypothetical protein
MKFCFQPYIEHPKPTSYVTWAFVLLRTAPGLRTGLELELLLASTSGTRTGSTLDLLLDLETLVGLLLLHSMHQSWSYAWVSCPHHSPPKDKWQKKCTSSSLIVGICCRDAMQLFTANISPPCCQCMNQGLNLEKMQLELLKYTKFTTTCYTCPNEQFRYSTTSYKIHYMITKFQNHLAKLR